MELSVNINYNQILRLIRQLPKRDIEKLTKTLQSEISAEKSVKTLEQLILQAPTWTYPEMKEYNKARSHINKSRVA
ncbi:MAG: hypothetical protein LC658_11890 [Bacteroidales bacterium]|nr:hypothetical protein [Bacteroidales bacterium]